MRNGCAAHRAAERQQGVRVAAVGGALERRSSRFPHISLGRTCSQARSQSRALAAWVPNHETTRASPTGASGSSGDLHAHQSVFSSQHRLQQPLGTSLPGGPRTPALFPQAHAAFPLPLTLKSPLRHQHLSAHSPRRGMPDGEQRSRLATPSLLSSPRRARGSQSPDGVRLSAYLARASWELSGRATERMVRLYLLHPPCGLTPTAIAPSSLREGFEQAPAPQELLRADSASAAVPHDPSIADR
jgi:hypothetical protein